MSCKLKQSHNSKLTRSSTDLGMIENYKNKIINESYTYYSMNGYGIERTKFDIDMKNKWNCDSCGSGPSGPAESAEYYAPYPYGLERTKFDIDMNKKWDSKEDYIGPRSNFDKQLQKKWAPGCPSCPCNQSMGKKDCNCVKNRVNCSCMSKEDFNDYLMSFDDTDNIWSYDTKGL